MERSVYKGKLLNLSQKKIKLPNGYIAYLEIVKHPGASLIIPFLDKNRIIFLRQYRPVIGSYIYELPAGTLDKGERALDCCRREIVEETGYSAAKFKRLGFIYPVPGYSTEKITIYKAEGLRKTAGNTQQDEVIRSLVFTKSRAVRLFKSGRIVDAKTIAALAMCGWL
ncbi:MAG: NUDIX hydrolase [Candidatus Omnitrophica bacterium]|nr:NUDIX hydrolase [Candidatus Omnitrophota bacterium]